MERNSVPRYALLIHIIYSIYSFLCALEVVASSHNMLSLYSRCFSLFSASLAYSTIQQIVINALLRILP